MLTIRETTPTNDGDGFNRRTFLKIGGLGFGGLSLADLLRRKACAASSDASSPMKSVIMVYLPGGPSHIDTYDLKPLAPAEYRGEFQPIATNVSGLEFCELMPRQASIADKLAVVRGIRFHGSHNPYELLSGYPSARSAEITEKWPSFGSVVSRIRGDRNRHIPPYVNLNDLRMLPEFPDPELPRHIGPAHRPFRPYEEGFADLELPRGVNLDRLEDRRLLLAGFDLLRHRLDLQHSLAPSGGLDEFSRRAFDVITSGRLHQALDLNREEPRVLERYGKSKHLLLARRMVEAGISVVTVAFRCSEILPDIGRPYDNWDTHDRTFKCLRANLPNYDHGIHALITDLYDRGLDENVAVVIWGEFGRGPKIGSEGSPDGRAHWPEAGFAVIAGGGLRMGQVIGATDARAERALGKAYTPQNVLATIYRVLGIDPATTFPDFEGRPIHLLDDREPIRELL